MQEDDRLDPAGRYPGVPAGLRRGPLADL